MRGLAKQDWDKNFDNLNDKLGHLILCSSLTKESPGKKHLLKGHSSESKRWCQRHIHCCHWRCSDHDIMRHVTWHDCCPWWCWHWPAPEWHWARHRGKLPGPHTGACPRVVTLMRRQHWPLHRPGGPHWAWYRQQSEIQQNKMSARHSDWQLTCNVAANILKNWRASRFQNTHLHCTLYISLFIACVPPWPETTLSCSAPSSPSVGALCFVSLKINSNITSLATTTTAQPRTPSQNVKWRIVRSYTNERDDEWTHCYFHCIVLLQMIMKCTYFENDALSPV